MGLPNVKGVADGQEPTLPIPAIVEPVEVQVATVVVQFGVRDVPVARELKDGTVNNVQSAIRGTALR
jgi:hypothetical protein